MPFEAARNIATSRRRRTPSAANFGIRSSPKADGSRAPVVRAAFFELSHPETISDRDRSDAPTSGADKAPYFGPLDSLRNTPSWCSFVFPSAANFGITLLPALDGSAT